MSLVRTCSMLLVCFAPLLGVSQPANTGKSNNQKKTIVGSGAALKSLDSFFIKVKQLCTQPANDNKVKQLLADNLKNNKAFLKEWEIGLNDKDAQIWHVLSALVSSPYMVDSSKATLTCKLPFVKNDGKVPGSKGVLQILPAGLLDVENEHDAINEKPDATSKVIGKVKPGELYHYFPGSTAYSASSKQYVANVYKDDSEGGINFYAIVLNATTHKLGYVSTNATWLTYPQMQLQYIGNQWKIVKLTYQ